MTCRTSSSGRSPCLMPWSVWSRMDLMPSRAVRQRAAAPPRRGECGSTTARSQLDHLHETGDQSSGLRSRATDRADVQERAQEVVSDIGTHISNQAEIASAVSPGVSPGLRRAATVNCWSPLRRARGRQRHRVGGVCPPEFHLTPALMSSTGRRLNWSPPWRRHARCPAPHPAAAGGCRLRMMTRQAHAMWSVVRDDRARR